jgi:hypothetical protein
MMNCAHIFWFSKQLPKELIALASQRLAATNNLVHCFSLHPAKTAGRISIKQAHNIQMLPHRSMAREECNYRSSLMPG